MNLHHRTNVPRIKSVPDLVRKECLGALVALVLVCTLSVALDAPLQGPADPTGIPAERIKAPWIFVGIQQMLRFLSPFLAGVLVPACAVIVVASLPFLPSGRTTLWIVFFGIVVGTVVLTIWGYLA